MDKMLVIFSHGEKGGVGKTAVASAAIELLLASTRRVAVVEGDTDNPDVAQRYQNSVHGLYRVRLSDPSEYQRSVNDLVNHLAECIENDVDAVVINMPAGAYTTVDKDVDTLRDAIEALEIEIKVMISTGNTDQSINRTAKIAKEGIGTLGQHLILAPEFLKDENLVEKIGNLGLDASLYPRMSPDVMQVILDYPTTPLHELARPGGVLKSPIYRIRITSYLRQANEVLGEMLGDLVDANAFAGK